MSDAKLFGWLNHVPVLSVSWTPQLTTAADVVEINDVPLYAIEGVKSALRWLGANWIQASANNVVTCPVVRAEFTNVVLYNMANRGGEVFINPTWTQPKSRWVTYFENGSPIWYVDMDGNVITLDETLPDFQLEFPLIPDPVCECGAFKVSKVPKGNPGHSRWCPWANQ